MANTRAVTAEIIVTGIGDIQTAFLALATLAQDNDARIRSGVTQIWKM